MNPRYPTFRQPLSAVAASLLGSLASVVVLILGVPLALLLVAAPLVCMDLPKEVVLGVMGLTGGFLLWFAARLIALEVASSLVLEPGAAVFALGPLGIRKPYDQIRMIRVERRVDPRTGFESHAIELSGPRFKKRLLLDEEAFACIDALRARCPNAVLVDALGGSTAPPAGWNPKALEDRAVFLRRQARTHLLMGGFCAFFAVGLVPIGILHHDLRALGGLVTFGGFALGLLGQGLRDRQRAREDPR